MEEARLIRRIRFLASHHYARADLSEEDNRRMFGDQSRAHEHDWTIEVRVRGPIDARTGFVTDLGSLDRALEEVLEGWSDGDLNQLIPEVEAGTMSPSTESLARWIYRHLGPSVAAPARLEAVAVFESSELGAEYPV